MAAEQRMSQAADPPLVAADLTKDHALISSTTRPRHYSSYSSEYTPFHTTVASVTDQMERSTSRPSTPPQAAYPLQNFVWKTYQQPAHRHVVGIPSSYQNSFSVGTPSTIGTHLSAKPARSQPQIPARKLAAGYAASLVPTANPNPYPGLDASDHPFPALKRKAELAQHLKPIHSFKKVKPSETSPKASKEKSSKSAQTGNDGGRSDQLISNPDHLVAERGQVTPSKGGKRNVGGRPHAKAGSKANQPKGPTRLRKNHPVVTEIPIDVWQNVLAYCPLDFLFKARLIGKNFDHVLSYESTWRDNRIRNYGPDMPGPPAGLNEMRYAFLLVGQGCMLCQDSKARKTYWVFLRRLCSTCLRKEVTMERANLALKEQYPKLFDCIPHATFDSFGNFETTGTYLIPPLWSRNSQAHVIGYKRSAITEKIAEIEEFMRVEAGEPQKTDEELDAWYKPQIEANNDMVLQLQAVEDWDNTYRHNRLEDTKGQKDKRAEYYQEQAKAMEPPLEPEALVLMQAYKRAIAIAKPPSERSWQILLPKLKEERPAAERIIREKREHASLVEHTQQCVENYRTLSERRAKNNTSEQIAVLAVADAVIESFEAVGTLHQIADVDLIHVILRKVHQRYYAENDASGPEDIEFEHRLLLADAKMVYECKIEPIINSWNDEARSKVAKLLKCPGCTRKDVQLRYTLDQLFCHIGKKHAPEIGDFNRLYIPTAELPGSVHFPWCRLEWPKNLPMLAEHHKATGKWDPDDESEYQEAPRSKEVVLSHAAYEGRSVSREGGPAFPQFVDNVIYAGSLLGPTLLPAKFKTNVAFKFALTRYLLASADAPPFEVLTALQLALMRGGHYDLFEHFRCLSCCEQPTPAKNNKFANRGQPFGELVEHYRSTHDPDQWSTDLFEFPSHEELWNALSEPGMRVALQLFDRLFPMKDEENLDPMLRGGYIAPVAFMG